MMERLYQPDFRGIFGDEFANAFWFPMVDTLIWPLFGDNNISEKAKNLLTLVDKEGNPLFYRRNIFQNDYYLERTSCDINLGFVQALDLNREYGITNSDVDSALRSKDNRFLGVCSINLTDPTKYGIDMNHIKVLNSEARLAGLVIYPSFQKIDLTDVANINLNNLCKFCEVGKLFLKIDVGNSFLPNNYAHLTTYDKIKSFISRFPKITVVISGADITGDINLYVQLLKYYKNAWIELDPRSIGGMNPTQYFKKLFSIEGFIQNCWDRIIIGSGTPTLEIPQMVRGFWEATEDLDFARKNLLRTWAFRNAYRILPINCRYPYKAFKTSLVEIRQEEIAENDNQIDIFYKIDLKSYSVTQLLYLTKIIKNLFEETVKKYPDLKTGEMMVRSYHTTTTLIINEHEYGNYLDLHYKFAEMTTQDSSKFLHTTMAKENRADFNHYDHEIASSYGSRQLNIPIINAKLQLGGRENIYVLVTFGPRSINLLVKIHLLKES